jgi:hypothetical protein
MYVLAITMSLTGNPMVPAHVVRSEPMPVLVCQALADKLSICSPGRCRRKLFVFRRNNYLAASDPAPIAYHARRRNRGLRVPCT